MHIIQRVSITGPRWNNPFILVFWIFTVGIYNGVCAAECDTGVWFCLRSLHSPRRPSPSSPASTAGPNEFDTQPRHGVSPATVQGLSPWAAFATFPRLSSVIGQSWVSYVTCEQYTSVFGKWGRRLHFSIPYVKGGGPRVEEWCENPVSWEIYVLLPVQGEELERAAWAGI